MKDQRDILLPLPPSSIACTLWQAKPLNIEIARAGTTKGKLFANLLAQHHYLGYKGSVGEHLPYLIWDRKGICWAVSSLVQQPLELRQGMVHWLE
jgi:hypothetical protein